MSQEIVYTSAPKGLKPGSRGFCTVVSTEGMAGNLADRLESHSGYRHAFGVNDERRDFNPVNWSHTTMRVAGTQFHVLSRVSDAGLDYSGRSNKLAHHVALDVSELPAAGPARTLLAPGVIRREWSGEIGLVARRKLPEIPIPRSYQAATWRRAAGDSAWAGVVAEKLLESNTPLSIIFAIQTDTMSLLTEVLDLIPLKQRWSISFSTYFTQLAPGTECRLRFVLDDTLEATALRKNPHAAVIDLVRKPNAPGGGELAECARSSQLPEHSLPPGPASPAHCPEAASDKAQARRDRPASAVEEVYDANWDESDGQEDVGEYQLKQQQPSHPHLLGKPKKSTRQSAYEMPGRPPRQLRTAGIIGGVVVGLALFASVSFLLIQRLRGPGLAPTPHDSVAGQMQPPPAPNKARTDTRVAVANTPKPNDGRNVIDAPASTASTGNPKGPVTDANSHHDLKNHGKSMNSPKTDGPEKNSDATPPVGKPKPKDQPPAIAKAEADPFEKLPRDPKDKRLAVLALPEFGLSNKPVTWNLALHNADEFQMTLIGSGVLLSKKLGEFKLISQGDQQIPGNLAWTLQLNYTQLSSENKLGEFRLSTGKDSSQLSFVWFPSEIRIDEVAAVPWLAVGLSTGKSQILCRLSDVKPISRLTCTFQNDKAFSATPSFDFPSQLLADRLKSDGSSFFMDILLPPELSNSGTYDYEKLKGLPLNTTAIPPVPLVAVVDSEDEDDFAVFRKDGPLGSISLKPIVDGKSFSLHITASASITVYDKDEIVAIKKAATVLNQEFVEPKRISSGLSTSGTMGNKVTVGAANQLTKAIQEIIAELTQVGLSRDKDIEQLKLRRDAAKPEDKMSFQMQIDSLSKEQKRLLDVVDRFNHQLKRHGVQQFVSLRKVLFGDKNLGSSDNSIRGIINRSTIGITVGYECEYKGEKYLIIIAEASE